MKGTIFGFISVISLLSIMSCSAGKTSDSSDLSLLKMSRETLDSIYSHYGIENECLLRENYPVDEHFKASYLADDNGAEGNPYSYLWPYSGVISAVRSVYSASRDSSDLEILDRVLIQGLNQYRDTLRSPVAYSSYVNTAPQSDRFYDDNIWIGIDFTDLYLLTGRQDFLEAAKEIWTFIESGTDNVLGGGIYWCEQKKQSKNTCSNAPATVYAMKLFEATKDSLYLKRGESLYDWTKRNLQDSTDYLYFDNVNIAGELDSAKYAYNSGQMIQAASLLYKFTGKSQYLKDAESIAENAYKHFFQGGEAEDDSGSFPLISKGNIWFTAVMMRGFKELYDIDHNNQYMEFFIRNLNHAWRVMRDSTTGLFNEDWSGKEISEKKWLLTQAAMTEMLSSASDYISNK